VIIPCIDLMGGKVVQLVRGREKALEADSPLAMLEKFAAFPEIQVIDLDAAMGAGSNDQLVKLLASRAATRVGGGVRTVERARALIEQGARKVIIGTAAFDSKGVNHPFLDDVAKAIGKERLLIALDSQDGKIVIQGWRQSTRFTAEQMIPPLESCCAGFLCTYVDKEGMLQGTDLEWFRRVRAATSLELTAAGGITSMEEVRALLAMDFHVALGMAVYTGRLELAELARLRKDG
jgi:phosphoribosylformimino-5-aminoimidazole carboxamide ribotide isomerase